MSSPSFNNNSAGNPSEDIGKLVLRMAVAILILFHGVSKLMAGANPIIGAVTAAGLPAAFGHLVYVGEVAAPLLILLGLFTRPAALVVAINMVVAILLVHTSQVLTLTQNGGWALELQGLYLFGALAIAFLGAGRLSIGGHDSKWN
jgi:putative oxidoreductase